MRKNNFLMNRRPSEVSSQDRDSNLTFPFLSPSVFQDHFFNDFFQNRRLNFASIDEDDKNYIVEAEVPGVSKKDIKISIRDNNLVIETNRKKGEDEKKSSLDVYLPENANVEGKIKAQLDKGILVLTIPKKEEKKAKEIEIVEIE